VDVFEQAGLYYTRSLNDDSGYWSSEKPPDPDIYIVFLGRSDTETETEDTHDHDENHQPQVTDQEVLDYLFATRTLYNDFFFDQN
jgi:hypothetical protein